MPNIIVATSGSVATIKLNLLLDGLKDIEGLNIKVVVTESSKHFVELTTIDEKNYIQVGSNKFEVYDDRSEWKAWNKRGDPVLHIELRKWADILLLAPCSANTLAKLAGGLSDNLLLSILRAWDINSKSKRVILAPAMNTMMWEHPLTSIHLDFVKNKLNYEIIPTVSKLLACGDLGDGAMAEVLTIINYINDIALSHQS